MEYSSVDQLSYITQVLFSPCVVAEDPGIRERGLLKEGLVNEVILNLFTADQTLQ